MATFRHVVECTRQTLQEEGFPLKGRWNSDFFGNANPITLELGCGKGEYTVGLARKYPNRNFIGVDIKGARMWKGASEVENDNIENAGFLRTQIELIDSFFSKDEIDEIWITFADPQMKKVNKRLTSTRFIQLYRNIMPAEGVVNLKTDSPFLYEYTRRMAEHNGLEILESTADLYSEEGYEEVKSIKTFYEQQWLSRGKSIKLIRFRIGSGNLSEPDVSDLEPDDYRAIPRFNPTEKPQQ